MIGGIDFSTGPAIVIALIATAAFPLLLAITARVPGLRDRNALQFSAASAVAALGWLIVAANIRSDWEDTVTGFLLLCCALTFYLELWALLSRGYTLGIMLTLARAQVVANADDLARHYRGGKGLDWIAAHRILGLRSAGLVEQRGQEIVLTPGRGRLVAHLYRAAIVIFGLRSTG